MSKKYNNLVGDINLAIEKFEEIQLIYAEEKQALNYSMSTDGVVKRAKYEGGISAYENVICYLKGLVETEVQK